METHRVVAVEEYEWSRMGKKESGLAYRATCQCEWTQEDYTTFAKAYDDAKAHVEASMALVVLNVIDRLKYTFNQYGTNAAAWDAVAQHVIENGYELPCT